MPSVQRNKSKEFPRMRPFLSVTLLCLLSLPCLAAEQHFDFEKANENGRPFGWKISADRCTARLDGIRTSGEKGLHFDCTNDGDGATAAYAARTVVTDPSRAGRATLSGDLRFEDVAAGHAGLWLRIDGADSMLKLKNMSDRKLGGTIDWARYSVTVRFPKESRGITFGALLSSDGQLWTDSLTLDIAYDDGPPKLREDLRNYLNTALDLIVEKSIFRPVDVQAFRRESTDSALGSESVDEIHASIVNALRRLGDGHSHIQSYAAMSHMESEDSGADVHDMTTKLTTDHIAIVEVPGIVTGNDKVRTRFVDHGHQALSELDSMVVCGWVVDLRHDHGGDMWPMLAALGPLLGNQVVGAFVWPDGKRMEWWYRDGGAGEFKKPAASSSSTPPTIVAGNAPLAVLIDANTASSGEMTAVAFKGRSQTRFFGNRTAGLATPLAHFMLPDGAALFLATSTAEDRTGKRYPVAVEPDVQIDSTDVDEKDNVLVAATDWLKQQPDCVDFEARATRP